MSVTEGSWVPEDSILASDSPWWGWIWFMQWSFVLRSTVLKWICPCRCFIVKVYFHQVLCQSLWIDMDLLIWVVEILHLHLLLLFFVCQFTKQVLQSTVITLGVILWVSIWRRDLMLRGLWSECVPSLIKVQVIVEGVRVLWDHLRLLQVLCLNRWRHGMVRWKSMFKLSSIICWSMLSWLTLHSTTKCHRCGLGWFPHAYLWVHVCQLLSVLILLCLLHLLHLHLIALTWEE